MEKTIIETMFLLLKDYISQPFEFTQKRFDQTASFVVDKNDQVKLTRDLSLIYFYYLDVLIFTINAKDGFNFASGLVEINSENREIILKRVDVH